MHDISGQTVNLVIVEINLHIRLVFGGKRKDTVNRGRGLLLYTAVLHEVINSSLNGPSL